MGVRTAMVDRARIIEKREAGVMIEGTTSYREVKGPWFKARLDLAENTDQVDPATGIRTAVRTPKLLFDIRDENGNDVVVNIEQRLEIDSKQLGRYVVYDVAADPAPLRKKRPVIAYETTLRRVVVHTADVV